VPELERIEPIAGMGEIFPARRWAEVLIDAAPIGESPATAHGEQAVDLRKESLVFLSRLLTLRPEGLDETISSFSRYESLELVSFALAD
jgi:hypothetical protein